MLDKKNNLCLLTLLILVLAVPVLNQECIAQDGKPVDWWLILKVPGKINKTGFGYTDARVPNHVISIYINKPDSESTALGLTLSQINTMSLEAVAWNDQHPDGTTSSTHAHSKTVLGFSQSTQKGFYLDHSLPKYPSFIDKMVNITIASAENIYGQHLFCMSLNLPVMEIIASKVLITVPEVYFSSVASFAATPNLYKLGNKQYVNSTNKFEYLVFNAGAIQIRSIYKNGKLNCSIFEDGLNSFLGSRITAETWGRPLQAPYCGQPYEVRNVHQVALSATYTWPETDDHSKWAFSDKGDSCFGDMNRMSSQWKRGGSFYCVQSSALSLTMQKIALTSDYCFETLSEK